MAGTSTNSSDIRKSHENYPSKMPQCAENIKQMFHEADIKEYEPHLIMQVCDIAYALTKEILLEARSVSEFSGKKQVDKSDIDFALKAFNETHCKDRPPKGLISEIAAEKNAQPLPPIRQNFGLRLPNDRFCQLQANFAYLENSPEQFGDESIAEQSMDNRQVERQKAAVGMNTFDPEAISSLLMSGNASNQRKRHYQEGEAHGMAEEDEDYD